jgi:tetratricopeptide (TPR) repeat protein
VDEQGFRHVHELLAQYFQQLADHEVAHDQPAPARYENSDWRRYAAETAYHALFANRDRGQFRLLTYFFEGAYLKRPDVAIVAFTAVAAGAEPKDNKLLPEDTQRFLDSTQLAIMFGWRVIKKNPDQYNFNLEKPESAKNQKNELIKAQIESALEGCFRKVDYLAGLAKYAGLMSKMVRCQPGQRLTLVRQAKEEAEKIVTWADPGFSGNLFFDISHVLDSLDLAQEALDSIDKSIELKPDYYGAWNNRGLILRKLERSEEALDSFDKSIELKPNSSETWMNRGSTLQELERFEEALDSFDEAVELKLDNYEYWMIRGDVLLSLKRYEEALASFDKASQLSKTNAAIWNSRGYA